MKFARILSLALLSLFVSWGSVSASVYVQGIVQWFDSDFDNSTGIGARVGYAFNDLNSLELEYTYTDLDSIDTIYQEGSLSVPVQGEAKVNTILLNYRFTYPLTERFRILAGAGAGVAVSDLKVTTEFGDGDGTNAVFTYQFFAGAEFFLLPQLSFHAAFRYVDFDDFDYEDGDVTVLVRAGSANIVEAGVSYYF
ncbi:MAG: porin family protein [Verrucomicrobiota bacterium]